MEYGPGYTLNLEDNSITADMISDHISYLFVITKNHNSALHMEMSSLSEIKYPRNESTLIRIRQTCLTPFTLQNMIQLRTHLQSRT